MAYYAVEEDRQGRIDECVPYAPSAAGMDEGRTHLEAGPPASCVSPTGSDGVPSVLGAVHPACLPD